MMSTAGWTWGLLPLVFHTASIPREDGMEGERTRNVERREPGQNRRFTGFPQVSGWGLFGLMTRRSQVRVAHCAPATKRTLGVPTCAEGFLAFGVGRWGHVKRCQRWVFGPVGRLVRRVGPLADPSLEAPDIANLRLGSLPSSRPGYQCGAGLWG